ncbi:MAG TPA: FtsW/RodA/SpoVE family cell cycle protein [Candidatus Doudnabacteria bacterium]|nr:FtsW/RodA/SpoVE family cell cycle protein [Candidatus Doudnabacteria bacterium]
MLAFFNRLKFYDLPLLIVSGLLLTSGLAIQYAISLSEADLTVFYRQSVYAVGAVVVFVLVANYNYQRFSKINRVLYPILIIALLYLQIFGDPIRGSASWIDFGFFQLQPAELAKIIIGVGLARWLYVNRGQINSWRNLALTFIYAGLPAGLVFFEPDLGSATILMSIWFGLILISPVRKIYIVILLAIAITVAGIGWQFVLRDYQKQRVEVFINPDLDPQGGGYNVRQAMIAVGSGQWFGRGLGQGVQSGLQFLPEKHTDFVFAAASEEIGLVGSLSILSLYVILLSRLLFIMRNARDDLGMYITGGVLFMIASQATINIGMNVGLLPVTGIPLPLLTAGGSSMLVTAIALGVVQNVAKQSKALKF